ncbi:hypothetical protein ABPG75_008606 [Micractinium tetrahymenae]
MKAAAGRCQAQQAQAYQPVRRFSNSSSSSSSSSAVLSNTTSFLRNLHNGAEIFIVGTAHVSKRSAEEVRDMIRLVKPQSVMVELCSGRAARLRSGNTDQDFLKQMLGSMFAPGGTLSQKLVQVSLPMMYRVLKLLGMDPGGEFKVALQEAERIGARVVYGDRDVNQTLQRLSQTMNLQARGGELLGHFIRCCRGRRLRAVGVAGIRTRNPWGFGATLCSARLPVSRGLICPS